MSQPTPYTPTTDFSQQESINASGRSTVNTTALDAELANIETTLDQTLSNLTLLQRDDGRLKDLACELHTLSPEVLNLMGGFNLKGLWAATTAYAVNDICSNGAYTYVCRTSHTSGGAFDSQYWIQFGFTSGADAAAAAAAAQGSATSAAGSATSAANSATAAANSASSISGAVSSAAASASTATAKAGAASASATNAAASAAAAAAAAASATGAEPGANSDITSLSGLTTPLSISQGGTGSSAGTSSVMAFSSALQMLSDGATFYMGIGIATASQPDAQMQVPFSGIAKNLFGGCPGAAAGTRAYTFMKNGVAQALTCSATGSVESASDTSHSVSFSPGDAVCIRVSATGGSDVVIHRATIEIVRTGP